MKCYVMNHCMYLLLIFLVDELVKLVEKGYGRLISKESMVQDGILPKNDCATVYMKPSPLCIDRHFMKLCHDPDLTETTYLAMFNKSSSDKTKIMVRKYHPHLKFLSVSQVEMSQSGNYSYLCMQFVYIKYTLCSSLRTLLLFQTEK